MSQPVFLHYTQAELDRNFDQRSWAKNALDVIARFGALSAVTRARLGHQADIAYGPGADERLDIFPATQAGAPVQVFVHGGAWRNFTKDDFSFAAAPLVPAGATVVIVNFSNLPAVRLPDMASQVRAAIAWTWRNIAQYGGDPGRLYLSGHSSGAHLAALALETDWPALGLPADIIKAATLVSGVYDLEPVLLSARSSYVFLDQAEKLALSANRHAAMVPCPVQLLYAEHDTDEFQRQTEIFGSALAERLQGFVRLPGLNHFEIMEEFGVPDGPVAQAILKQMGLTPTDRA